MLFNGNRFRHTASTWKVEHRKRVAEPAGAHPGLQDKILQNYTRIENAHKVRKTSLDFCYV